MGCAPSNDATFITHEQDKRTEKQRCEPIHPTQGQRQEPVYPTQGQRHEPVSTTQGQNINSNEDSKKIKIEKTTGDRYITQYIVSTQSHRHGPVSKTWGQNIKYWTSLYEDSKKIKIEKTIGDQYISQYIDLLDRFIKLYELHHGNIPRNPSMGHGDPNDVAFPLPVSSNCLRPWVDKVHSLSFLGGIFSFEIEGEAAWHVFPKDIIKNDIQTPAQEDIWRVRKNRTDLEDPARMNKRRQELANYFNKKYAEGDNTYSAKYLQFADNLDAGWKRFQELCV